MEFNRILVPVAGSMADRAAMELACSLSRQKNQAEIFAVHVIPVDRSLPLDADVGTAVDKAENLLEQVTTGETKLRYVWIYCKPRIGAGSHRRAVAKRST
jgi:hypothetical protein